MRLALPTGLVEVAVGVVMAVECCAVVVCDDCIIELAVHTLLVLGGARASVLLSVGTRKVLARPLLRLLCRLDAIDRRLK